MRNMNIQGILVIVAVCVLIAIIWETCKSRMEGFTTLSEVIKQTIPRRYDVTLDNDLSEETPYVRDRRFWT